jgi:hypothetical protein
LGAGGVVFLAAEENRSTSLRPAGVKRNAHVAAEAFVQVLEICGPFEFDCGVHDEKVTYPG